MGRYKYVWPYAYGQAHGQFGDVTIGLLCGDVTIGLLCGDVTIGLLGGDCQETHPPREKFEVDQLVSYGGWSGQLLQLACQVFSLRGERINLGEPIRPCLVTKFLI